METLRRALALLVLAIPLAAFGGDLLDTDAGPDLLAAEGAWVYLDGKGTLKNKGLSKTKTIAYSWVQTNGRRVDLIDANTANPSFLAPKPNGPSEVLSFQLTTTAAIGQGKKGKAKSVTDSDLVDITIAGVVAPSASTIEGRVTDVAGDVVAGANVQVLDNGSSQQSDATDASGNFDLNVSDDTEYVLKFTATGYTAQIVPVKSPAADESIFLEVTMLAQGGPQTFDSSVSAHLTGPDGAMVSVSPGGFVDADGNLVTGDIQVTITPLDVSRPASLAAFPGEFFGFAEGGTVATPIISFGAVEYKFTQDGQPVQLAAEQTADIEIPIYIETDQDGMPIRVNDIIPLWYLDEDTGIWKQEEIGTVVESTDSPTGLALAASVNHFSWWNSDVAMNTAEAAVTVFGADMGTAVIKARTTAYLGWQPAAVDAVTRVGVSTDPLYIPSDVEVCFWAEINYTNGAKATTFEECVTAGANSLVNVDLVAPVDGDLLITTRPAATASELDVTGYVGFPIDPVSLHPATIENAVSYEAVDGAVPAGVTLHAVNATRAKLSGIPTEAGSFSVTIEGVDAEDTTDLVIVNYTVSTNAAPPDLGQFVRVSYTGASVPITINLNDYNNGGPAVSWSLSSPYTFPSSMNFDPTTGSLTISRACTFFSGDVAATNVSGSSIAPISIGDSTCN